MKKYVLALVLVFGLAGFSQAEETVVSEPAVVEPAAEATTSPAPETPAVEASAADEAAAEVADAAENLEFISGEVSSVDEASQTITVKLYGETENTPGDKSVTVKVEASTDITDGEKDRDLKSLTAGTEVDVEYDPASDKATYIFVY